MQSMNLLFDRLMTVAISRSRDSTLVLAACVMCFITQSAVAQDTDTVVNAVVEMVRDRYVNADLGEYAAEQIILKHQNGEYSSLGLAELGPRLQRDLRSITNDKHFAVAYNPGLFQMVSTSSEEDETSEDHGTQDPQADRSNYGFTKIELLKGNVGLLKIDEFLSPGFSTKRMHAASMFLADSDAVIVDLRDNWGGEADVVPIIASYFMDNEDSILLGERVNQAKGTTTPIRTNPDLPGLRLPQRLYFAVGPNTRSAAEALAYHLQAFGRAVVVGESTSGGAHAGDIFSLVDNFVMFCPTTTVTNAVTGSDWEGTGVIPDHTIQAQRAVELAQLLSLQFALIEQNDKMPQNERQEIKKLIEDLEKKLEQ